eukprot:gene4865-5504_t
MVKITSELIIKHGSHSKKQNYENDFQFLRRLTHIYLQEKHIDEIVNLEVCKHLSVLYLYDNKIKRIKNLSFASNLTHLYLQKNQISRIDGLSQLSRLSKLYLGGNSITVIEGLEGLHDLAELHIENQRLPAGESLLFDPRTLESLAKCLRVLNISGNYISDVSELSVLVHITQFYASHNHISDFYDLSCAVRAWPSLSKLELSGNPCCHKKKYRDKITLMSRRLVMLDGKEVNEATRLFLQSWQANKEMKKAKRKHDSNHIHHGNDDGTMVTEETDRLPSISMSQLTVGDADYALHHPVTGPFTKQNKRFTTMLTKTMMTSATEKKDHVTGDELSIR